ncbi:MAG: ABC transporter permease [Candidatus Korobacteraceae bacterium]|jgi:ABC-2 type transport system permease protein
MATTTFPTISPVSGRSLPRTIALYFKEAKYELLKNIRIPVYAISTVAFPVMFYVLFGIVLGSGSSAGRNDNATYMLATMGCFGVIAVALFGFGVSLAMERGQGWLQVKRASPMPVSAYFLGKLFSAVVFSTVIMLLLLALGFTFGGVRLPLATAAKLVGILVAGSIPFSAMGMAIGYFAKPNSAPGLVNLIYLPMSFCSGLWIPLFMLPHGLQTFAKLLPPYHLSQLALSTVGMVNNPTPAWGHVEALIAFTFLFLGLAAWGYRRDEGKTYG